MAGKRITGKASGWQSVRYDCHTRTLFFIPNHSGCGLLFRGVPAELFYGMPSGANLDNFIEIKLWGRYVCERVPTPPALSMSRINQTYTYIMDGVEYEVPIADRPLVPEEWDLYRQWEFFVQNYGSQHQPKNGIRRQSDVDLPEL